jgi:hypothetical protein
VPTQYICSSSTASAIQLLFRGRIIDQREIDLGCHQVHQRRARQAFGERQLQIGVFGKNRLHQGNADRLHTGARHADRDLARDGVATFLDLALGLGHRAQDDAGVLVEPLGRGGGLHAARFALEQRRSELGFEVGNVMAQRRLRDIGLVGGARQIALLVDGDEIAKLARIH